MRGGYDQFVDRGGCSPGMTCGGRKRRSMGGGQINLYQEGGRKRSMRGGQFTSMSRIDNGGRKRRTMRGGVDAGWGLIKT